MWIDINAYTGNWPYKQLRNSSLAGLLSRMDRFGIDKAVVAGLSGIHYKNTQPANEELHQELKSNASYKERIIPFAVINPAYPGWQQDLKKCIGKGFRGIRIYPQYHDYLPEDPVCTELVRICREEGLITAFTIRMVDSRQRSWLDIPHVAGTAVGEWTLRDFMPLIRAVPDAQYFVLNVANGLAVDGADLPLLKKTNILFDTSGRSLGFMPDVLRQYPAEKFAFGSHSPILDYVTGMLRIESLRPDEAGEREKELMRSGNALRFLNQHR